VKTALEMRIARDRDRSRPIRTTQTSAGQPHDETMRTG
jgi:hypothetical protein